MAKNIFITDNEGRVPFTAGGTLASGALHEVSNIAGVVLNDVVSGQTGILQTGIRGPVIFGKDATSQEWATPGIPIYLAGDTLTSAAGTGDNPFIGYSYLAKLEAGAVGYVLLAHGAIGPGA